VTALSQTVTGAGDPNHPMMQWFHDEVAKLEWRKERALPEWATNIFSTVMGKWVWVRWVGHKAL
jgi:hypothetical protein